MFNLFLMLFGFFLVGQGCSLSASIKTQKSIDNLPSTPVVGDDDFRITQPTDYINPSNSGNYVISGSCRNGETLQVKVEGIAVETIQCENGNFNASLDLSSQGSGYITIEVVVVGGDEDQKTSVQVLKDIEAPTIGGVVTDGVYYSSTIRTPSLTWSSGADAHSGIFKYQIAIGTSSGATNIADWEDVTSSASGFLTGLNLVNGTTYFASVRALDAAGNVSSAINSDGWIVDTNAPTLATNFIDGIMNFSNASSTELSWTASSDSGSGISGYQLALGTTSGGNDLLDWTNIGNVTSAILNSLTLNGNQRIYPSIRTKDAAENVTSSVLGDGWWNLRINKKAIDTTTPEARSLTQQAFFGYSVAISSDETTIAIGAYGDDYDENGSNYLSDAGAVFIYTKVSGNWVFQQKVVATGLNARAENQQFGNKISIDGNTLAVGVSSHSYDENGANYQDGAGAVFVYIRSGNVWSLQQKIVASGTNARVSLSTFGDSVSLDQDTLAVGSSQHSYDASGSNSVTEAGAVFVYTRSGSSWSLQQKLVATGTNARMSGDYFGHAVSLDSETLAISSPYHDYNVSGAGSVSSAGAVYVFTRAGTVWTQQQKIIPIGTNARIANDYFGNTLDLDGETLAVGSPQNSYDANGNNLVLLSGAVFVFTRSGSVWSQQQKLVSTGVNSRVNDESFGASISLSTDSILIGATGQRTDENGDNELGYAGAFYHFTRSGVVWSQQQKVVASGVNARTTGARFGRVNFAGSTAIVGASGDSYNQNGEQYIAESGSAYIFDFSGASWNQNTKLVNPTIPASRQDTRGIGFGKVVAISDDGQTLAVSGDNTDASGLNYVSESGSVYVYIKSSGNWVFQQKLVASGVNARHELSKFGSSISIYQDTLAIGANQYSYDASGSSSVPYSGAVYVFTRSGGVWTQQQRVVASGSNSRVSDDYFGAAVSVYQNTLVVGSPGQDYDSNGDNYVDGAGAIFVFTRSGGVWSQEQKIVATGTNSRMMFDGFGSSVALDQETLVAGAPAQDYNATGSGEVLEAGAAYVFIRSAGVWSLQQKLIATGTNARSADDSFGGSVKIYADTVAISSINQDYDELGNSPLSNAGAIYVFSRSGGVWSQDQKIVATGTNARISNDQFGYSIGLNQNTLAVGSPFQNFDSAGINLLNDAGAVFVYSRQSMTWSQSLKLTPTGTNSRIANDGFGFAVDLSENASSDGYSLIIGAPFHDADSNGTNSIEDAGAAFIFD